MAKFKDGTVQQYAMDGWSVPPLPRLVPELTAACPVVKTNPTQIRAKLRISATGEVTGISGPVLTKDNPDLGDMGCDPNEASEISPCAGGRSTA